MSGKSVKLTQGLGMRSTISPASVTTTATGVAAFSVKNNFAESVTYTATDTTDGIAISQTAGVTFVPGPVSATVSTVAASPASVRANGVATSTITVTLKDTLGVAVAGKTVALSQAAGKHSVISPASGVTNSSGVVTFTVTNTTVESVVYTARDTTDSITLSPRATVSFTP